MNSPTPFWDPAFTLHKLIGTFIILGYMQKSILPITELNRKKRKYYDTGKHNQCNTV